MTDYVLDTNTCIYWLKGKEEIRRKVEEVGADHLKTTIITLAELRYGSYNSQKVKENLKNIDNFLRKVDILPLHEEATDIFGKLKVELRRIGRMIEDFDILIASITLSHGGILVTNNVEHFKKIGGTKPWRRQALNVFREREVIQLSQQRPLGPPDRPELSIFKSDPRAFL